jgi:hypothetical protein
LKIKVTLPATRAAALCAAAALFALLAVLVVRPAISEAPKGGELQKYGHFGSIGTVIDDSRMNEPLSEADVAKMEALTLKIGEILYETGTENDPEDVKRHLRGTDPEKAEKLASAYDVESKVLLGGMTDVKMKNGTSGDLLAFYLLDYKSRTTPQDRYIFIMNLSVAKDEDGEWTCTDVRQLGSATAIDHTLSRDGITGKIVLEEIPSVGIEGAAAL